MSGFLGFFERLFSSYFLPHGHCCFWQPARLWLHAGSDGLSAAITALLSVATAFATVKVTPPAPRDATPGEMERINQSLREEIEARKAAEEKLWLLVAKARQSGEAKLRSYLEAASQAILTVSSEGKIVLVNRRTEEMFGYDRTELIGQPLEVLLPERYRNRHVALRAGYFADPRVRPMGAGFDLAGRRKDGSEFPVVIGLSYLDTEEGRLALGMITDITERKRASDQLARVNAELRASEAQLRSYLEAASQGILAVSSNGLIQLVNRRTEEMFGYDRSELVGQPLEILLPERYHGRHVSLRRGYFAEPRLRAMGAGVDLAGRRKDGTEFPVEIGLSPVQTEAGTLALGLVSDITERKQAADQLARVNAELRASEAHLRSYLEAASQGILAVSGDGLIQLVNRRTEEMFGYDRAELIGRPLEILLPEGYRSSHVGLRAAYFADPSVRPMGTRRDLAGRRKDGTEFPVEVGLSSVQTENGRLALGLISDITERKRAADALSHVNDELRGLNAQLEQFAYVASHDLQEPLRMVSSYLELLDRRYREQLDSQAREFIHYAVDGARRMKGLIQDLLSFSRAGTTALNSRTVQVQAILQDVLANLMVAIEQGHAEVTADPLPEIVADPGLLALVFQNLIGNAIKFQKNGTPRVHVSAQRTGAEWIFSVRDNGIGIEIQHATRVFRIFERLHGSEQYPGTGVGLAITQRIVERHGGKIWFESKLGIGTTFFFTVPDRVALKAQDAANPAMVV